MVGVAYKIWGLTGKRQVVRFNREDPEYIQIKDSNGDMINVKLSEVNALISGVLGFINKHVTKESKR